MSEVTAADLIKPLSLFVFLFCSSETATTDHVGLTEIAAQTGQQHLC